MFIDPSVDLVYSGFGLLNMEVDISY